MDHLWTPWRYAYVTAAETTVRPGVPPSLSAWPGDLGCVFCNLIASIDYGIAHGIPAEQAEGFQPCPRQPGPLGFERAIRRVTQPFHLRRVKEGEDAIVHGRTGRMRTGRLTEA